jgi:small conductance mechanosensitive channel
MPIFRRHDGRRSAMEAMHQLRSVSAGPLKERAKAAQRRAAILLPAVVGVVWVEDHRMQLFGLDEPVRLACAFALVGLGAWFSRDLGRALGPALLRRLDQGTAGSVAFLMRLGFLIAAVFIALHMAGVTPRTLAVGGAVTGIVLGLAAQATIGNLFAGLMLLSVRPFRAGDRVRIMAGALGGTHEGVVEQLGLLYVTLRTNGDVTLIPNNGVMASAIMPVREPGKVDLRARLRPGVKPSELQQMIENAVKTPTRENPHIELEEVDDTEVVMRVMATPLSDADGPKLADEVLSAVDALARADGSA